MAAAVKFEAFTEHLAKKIHDLHTDTVKILLAVDAPSASLDAVKADLTSELATANGYTLGGEDTLNTVSRSGGTSTVTATDVVWTASGGSIGPFRYVVAYNDTPASGTIDPLIEYWDYGSNVTLLTGETFTADFGASGLMTIA